MLQPTGPGPGGCIADAMLMQTLLKTVTKWKLILILESLYKIELVFSCKKSVYKLLFLLRSPH